jgi:hypothetical protein
MTTNRRRIVPTATRARLIFVQVCNFSGSQEMKVAFPGSGGREDWTMPEDYDWKERRDRVERYRILAQETTDPIAARLLHDIVLDLEAELEGLLQSVGLDAA